MRFDADGPGAGGGAFTGHHVRGFGGGGILVVLTDKQDRQVKDACPVQPFQKRSAIDRAIAEEIDDDAPIAQHLRPMRRARADMDVRADNAVRTQHPNPEIRDVHGSALAAAATAVAAQQLLHHRGRVCSLRQGVAVAAVGRQDQVGLFQMRHDPSWDRLLPDRQMDRAEDKLITGRRQLGLFFEGANPLHHLQQGKAPCGVVVGRGHARPSLFPLGVSERAARSRSPTPGQVFGDRPLPT